MIACLLPWPHLPPILFTLTCEGRRGEERRRAEGAAPLHQIPITKNRPNRQSGWMTKRPTIFHGAPAPRRPVHCHQNGDHYIASLPSHCPTARPRPPASPSGATSSETNSVVWIWMTTSSMTETRSRAQRPTEAEEGGREGGREAFSVCDNNRDVIVATIRTANGRRDSGRLRKSVSSRHHHLLLHPSFNSAEILSVSSSSFWPVSLARGSHTK